MFTHVISTREQKIRMRKVDRWRQQSCLCWFHGCSQWRNKQDKHRKTENVSFSCPCSWACAYFMHVHTGNFLRLCLFLCLFLSHKCESGLKAFVIRYSFTFATGTVNGAICPGGKQRNGNETEGSWGKATRTNKILPNHKCKMPSKHTNNLTTWLTTFNRFHTFPPQLPNIKIW